MSTMNEHEFLNNPANFNGQEYKTECLEYDEPFYFALKDNHHTFALPISTLLQCLKFAENEGVIPPIDQNWWAEMKMQFRVLADRE